jgi:hypothetical protein
MSILTRPDHALAFSPLATTLRAIRARHGATAVQGVADPLLVSHPERWIGASSLIVGSQLPSLLDIARDRWNAAPHAAATLAWKSYSYWLALPAVLSWAAGRRVPMVGHDNIVVRLSADAGDPHAPFLQLGFRAPDIAVLPDDPLAHSGAPGVRVVADEQELLEVLRGTLLDQHLDPLSERIREQVKVGRRTLQGSVASGVSYAVIRAADALPGPTTETVRTLLAALDLADLVDIVPGATGAPDVQRRTCCLAFTLPEPKVCSGCCLRNS